jgi:hypothetical protein
MAKGPLLGQDYSSNQISMEQLNPDISQGASEPFIDYAMVLKNTVRPRGRGKHTGRIKTDLDGGLEIKDKIFSQSILGRDEFIEWVKEKYIDRRKGQEIPAVKAIQRYRSNEAILRAIEGETGKGIDEIKKEKGLYRQIAMDLLYRIGDSRAGRLAG